MPQIALLIVLLSSLLAPVFPAQQPADDLKEKALAFIEQLVQGEYTGAVGSFDPTMRDALPAAKLQSLWEDLTQRFGPYQSTGPVTTDTRGEYTGVVVETHFERAVVNLRVVFNTDGQISGFFYTPSRVTTGASPWQILALAFTALFAILFPVLLAALAHRRLSVPWRYFGFGAGVFIIFQLVTRIPIVQVIEVMFGAQIRASTWLFAAWVVVLCFTAGLFEETGRYVGFRWMAARDPKTWPMAIMFGLGHGGIESIVLVGLSSLVSFLLLLLAPFLQNSLPAEAAGPLMQSVAVIGATPAWQFLLAAWERLWTLPVHVALSVIVLQVFRRSSFRWLWLAILLHAAVNLVVVGLPLVIPLPGKGASLFSSWLVFLAGLLAVWAIFRLREPAGQPIQPGVENAHA
jgi:uncharacterized membrane protein YhfC